MSARMVIVLPSIHDVLEVEARIGSEWEGKFEIVPTPTAISSDCGMVLECAEAHIPALAGAIRRLGIFVQSIWRRAAGGDWVEIDASGGRGHLRLDD